MTSITLAESAVLCQDMLLAGVISNFILVDRFYEILPFMELEGNSLAYNRELALGDVEWPLVGGTITAKGAATFQQKYASLHKIIGDAEVDQLIQATRSNINDQKAAQLASKAKSIARTFADNLINGDFTGSSNHIFDGLTNIVAGGQTIDAVKPSTGDATNGGPLTFELLDTLLDLVKDKDGQVDYLCMTSRELRKYYSLLRGLGGATIGDVITLPSGAQVPGYRGTPIFKNDSIPVNITKGSSTDCSMIFAGSLDDGSGSVGLTGITAKGAAGVRVEEVGVAESKDETITRVKWYVGIALFSEFGLAMAQNVTPDVDVAT